MTNLKEVASKIVFVGTFPPTEEGIATFNKDLTYAVSTMIGKSGICEVAAVNLADTSPYYSDDRVRWEIDQEIFKTYKSAAKDINDDPDVKCLIIQHEYGIFGGIWGEYFIDFLYTLEKPVITVLHSVLEDTSYYSQKFKEVTRKIILYSNAIVVLSQNSKEILNFLYPEFTEKIYFIPHGIHPVKFVTPEKVKQDLGLMDKTVLTTFGLLSRDKGIEYVLKALPKVVKSYPEVLYQFLGQTHPVIRKKEGEVYRTYLVDLVKKLNLRKNVRFEDRYLTLPELLKYLQGTDLYIATSTNKDQAVSGTFSYAVGSGRAIVSTSFVQSKEVVTKNMGRLVPVKNSGAFTKAIKEMLSDRKKLYRYGRNAYSKTRSMLWTNVAKEYIYLVEKTARLESALSLPEVNLEHLKKMTRNQGLLQFSQYDLPNEDFGITVDDNARALIVINWLIEENFADEGLFKLHKIYFKLLKKSQRKDGLFTNYFDIKLNPTEQNIKEDPKEHMGRAMLALAENIINLRLPAKTRSSSKKMWDLCITNLEFDKNHLRPIAFMIKALALYYENYESSGVIKEKIIQLTDILLESYLKNSTPRWQWFESSLTYNNSIIPESLALASKITRNRRSLKVAKKTFSFLIKKTFFGSVYVPIGQKSWHRRGRKRTLYDQQPEDVGAAVLGLLTMYDLTKLTKYLHLAKNAFSWFLGNNLNGIPLYNFRSGGVHDGLTPEGVNKNQGAEALVSYLLARIRIAAYF